MPLQQRLLGALRESKARREQEIEELKQKSAQSLEDYNLLKICLTVLLNDDYLEMAVLRSQLLRDVTNIYAHVKDNVINEQIRETAQHVQELFKRVELMPEKRNIDGLMNGLSDILHCEGDFYFASGDSSVECMIDEHLLTQLDKYDNDLAGYTDMRMLLERLDSL